MAPVLILQMLRTALFHLDLNLGTICWYFFFHYDFCRSYNEKCSVWFDMELFEALFFHIFLTVAILYFLLCNGTEITLYETLQLATPWIALIFCSCDWLLCLYFMTSGWFAWWSNVRLHRVISCSASYLFTPKCAQKEWALMLSNHSSWLHGAQLWDAGPSSASRHSLPLCASKWSSSRWHIYPPILEHNLVQNSSFIIWCYDIKWLYVYCIW